MELALVSRRERSYKIIHLTPMHFELALPAAAGEPVLPDNQAYPFSTFASAKRLEHVANRIGLHKALHNYCGGSWHFEPL